VDSAKLGAMGCILCSWASIFGVNLKPVNVFIGVSAERIGAVHANDICVDPYFCIQVENCRCFASTLPGV
jgi:hypothetical protein